MSPLVASGARVDRSGSLDGLRGVAVLIVFLSHTSGRDIKIAPWLDFAGIGHVGVYLFFVLSGLLLLTRNLLDGQPVSTFLIRRFFRIAPLYYLVLIATFTYQVSSGHVDRSALYIEKGFGGLLLSLAFLRGDGVFWTIAAEFAFYALLPLVVIGIARFGWGWVACVALVSFAWLLAIRILHWPLPPLRVVAINHPTQYFDVFLAGVAAAYVKRDDLPHRLIACIFVATITLTIALVSRNVGFHQPLYSARWLSLPYAAVFAFTVVSLATGRSPLNPIMDTLPLRFVGIVGFSWYLLHLAVFVLIKDTGVTNGPLLFLLATIAVAIASAGTFYFVEKPAMRWGRRFEFSKRQVVDESLNFTIHPPGNDDTASPTIQSAEPHPRGPVDGPALAPSTSSTRSAAAVAMRKPTV